VSASSLRILRRFLPAFLVLAALAAGGYLVWLDAQVRERFEGRRWALPAWLYARPLELYPGAPVDRRALERELARLGYRRVADPAAPGGYRPVAGGLEVHLRPFPFWDGREPARRVRVGFEGGRVASLRDGRGGPLALARLEPAVIGRPYPARAEDRILLRLEEFPPLLLAALQAVEDRRFREHHGVDPRALARALLANLRAGRVVEGGSTLTQQLVKNLYLDARRTLGRKAREVLMALLLELRYGKDEILEAYCNEVYLGQDGRRAIHGFGLASRFYFDRPLEALGLPEIALLVGLVKGPSRYDPRRHPERALARRTLVLRILAREGVVGREAAEAALAGGLPALERRRGLPEGSLQGAVVVLRPADGEVLAVVGGRDPGFAGFDRALDARRPVGSLVKPAV